MWISKKKFKELEKRIADLEKEVQSQPEKIMKHITESVKKVSGKNLII